MTLRDIPCLTNPTHSFHIHNFQPSSSAPPLPLHIPTCLSTPPHPLHPPNPDLPLRINIEGPILALQRLLPEVPWQVPPARHNVSGFPMPGGPALAALAFREIYGRDPRADVAGDGDRDMVLRDESKAPIIEARPIAMIDYYGVTFDHLVPPEDPDPEVLQINIVEIEDDGGVYANRYNPFDIDPAEYVGKKVLAVPRCCQNRKGTTDRLRVNIAVNRRDGTIDDEFLARYIKKSGDVA
ncbi:hypothetical protein SBOR_4346 [Sclerotinia borealis F-4128]|uniref:Uncharacterized protein n=1 Tax=Sclerotinia borealis (strain F-4128) TaxID=1432307 RepID=W9CKP9_SCLBF|nr:hypothetical protein SBOR_4346 [Sclerotinia borealis F-4128]